MEKLLYPLWKVGSLSGDDFRDQLLLQLAPHLTQIQGVHGLRICVVDSAVSAAAGRSIESQAPSPDALLSLWVNFAGAAEHWEPLIDTYVASKTAYLVAEAEPLVSQQAHPSAPGERLYGLCQVVFMSPPDGMDRDEWLSIWKDSHTQVAIDTQSTFGYRQNLVVRRLSQDAPVCFAVVEENFPPEAMASDHAFYATGGDEALLQKHRSAMIESCARFIDFQKIDVIPMSEYLVKPVTSE
ncbi:MAG: hypothetical protein P8J79_05435 [Halioglobus sp.]|nr:hypothetical protein [Halioglobus sp.]